jgi:hypothetical protein
MAILYLPIQKEIAPLFNEGTLFIPGAATEAIGHPDSLALNIILPSKVSAADTAVHTAGCDQFFVHCLLHNIHELKAQITRCNKWITAYNQ